MNHLTTESLLDKVDEANTFAKEYFGVRSVNTGVVVVIGKLTTRVWNQAQEDYSNWAWYNFAY